jgi:hypothetical protein
MPATAGEISVKGTDGSVDLGNVNIDSSGRLLVGTSSNTYSTGTAEVAGTNSSYIFSLTNTTASDTDGHRYSYLAFTGTQSGGEKSILASVNGAHDGSADDTKGILVFRTNSGSEGGTIPTERMRITSGGEIIAQRIYDNTTANAPNVWVSSGGQLNRSTSSVKYKTDIESIQDSYSDALLSCRPVWYRSTCKSDNPAYGWWGFIAEEVAAIDPRLVHWKTIEVTYDENGSAIETPCDPEPEGVAYDRFVPHLLNLIKRQQAAIETLEAKVAALEAG